MPEYKILRISQDPPREWGEGANKTYYIKTMLEGHNKPVSIGKKDPHALKVGETVSGTITETQYETDKFTAERRDFHGGQGFSGSKPSYQPRDDDAIRAQWAIGQAVSVHRDQVNKVESFAKYLYEMVDRVKGSQQTSYAANASTPTGEAEKFANEPDPEFSSMLQKGLEADGINIDDIPF